MLSHSRNWQIYSTLVKLYKIAGAFGRDSIDQPIATSWTRSRAVEAALDRARDCLGLDAARFDDRDFAARPI